MPKIPLYNQGGPSPVELAAGRLGARPNEAALAAPARALTDLGETIGRTGRGFAQGEMRVQQSKLRFEEEKARVDFQFKKAEQERQDRDELKKIEFESLERFTTLRNENVSTNTTDAEAIFDADFQKYSEELKGRGYTNRFLSLALNQAKNSFVSNKLYASANAFNRGTEISTENDNTIVANAIQTFVTFGDDSPEAELARKNVIDIQQTARNEGRTLKISTEDAFIKAYKYQGYLAEINRAETPEQLEEIRQRVIDDSDIIESQKPALLGRGNTETARLRREATDAIRETIASESLSIDELNRAIDASDQGDNAIVKDNGDVISLPFGQIGGSARAILRKELSSMIAARNADLQNISAEIIIDGFESRGVQGSVEFANAVFERSKNKENAEKAILASADLFYTQASVAASKNDFDLAKDFVAAAEALLNTRFGDRQPLSTLVSPVGNSARNILGRLPGVAKEIDQARLSQDRVSDATESILNNTWATGQYTIGATPAETEAALAGALVALGAKNEDGKPSLPQMFQLLQKNNLVIPSVKSRFDATYSLLEGPDADFTDPVVLGTYEAYKSMNIFGSGLVERHTEQDTRKLFNAAMVFETSGGKDPSDALRLAMMGSKTLRSASQIQGFRDKINTSLTSIIDQTEGGFLGWFAKPIRNQEAVRRQLNDLALQYVQLDIPSIDAINLAKEEVLATSFVLNGILTPRSRNYPANLEHLVQLAAVDFYSQNSDEDIDLSEINLRPVVGRSDEFMVFEGDIAAGVDMKNNVYTLNELLELGLSGREKALADVAANWKASKAGTSSADAYEFLVPQDLRVETETVRPFNRGLSIQPKKIPLEQVFPSLVIGSE